MADIKNVTVLGTGTLGSQIAFATAYAGFPVVAYDISDAVLEKAKARFKQLQGIYEEQVKGAAGGKAQAGFDNITYSSNLADAVKDADLVIEAIPEVFDIKRSTYQELAKVAPAKTIFATNTSTLLPSSLMEYTGRPEKFLALHFANTVWINNTAEVMGTSKTDPAVYQQLVQFAKDINMVPIQVKKEHSGYLLNSLLVPFLNAAAELWVEGIGDIETIDETWRIATGAPYGPFQIYDVVGLQTAYNISVASKDQIQQEFAAKIKKDFMDQGKYGVSTGEGFYKY